MNGQQALRVVYLEDDPDDAEIVLQKLRQAVTEVSPERVDSEAAFLTALDVAPDLILADYRVAEFGAVGALRALAARAMDVPLIVVSSTVGDEGAVECLREGATEYFLQGHLGWFGQAVCNAVAQARLRSEQRRMAEALRASEERYRLLFDESPYLMWVVEIDTLRFLEVNRKAVSHYGYRRHEFLSMTLLDIQQPEEGLGTREGLRAVRAGEPRVSRQRHRTQSGELLEVAVTSRPVEFAGRSALLAVIEDVSERHRREAKLRQAQRM
jgi:PAS domain S-box-containing protein